MEVNYRNVKYTTIQLLEQNLKEYCHDAGIETDFLNKTQKHLKRLINQTSLKMST